MRGLLQDRQGNESSGRLGFIICIVTGCVIGLLAVIFDRDLASAGVLAGVITSSAFAGKGYQVKQELKNDRENNS